MEMPCIDGNLKLKKREEEERTIREHSFYRYRPRVA
jgi:hypothetical protein